MSKSTSKLTEKEGESKAGATPDTAKKEKLVQTPNIKPQLRPSSLSAEKARNAAQFEESAAKIMAAMAKGKAAAAANASNN